MKIKKYKTQKGLINAVHKLLSDKDHWTRGADAMNKYGVPVSVNDSTAERFCVRGALKACAADQTVFKKAYQCLSNLTPYQRGVVSVNDTDGYEAVMALLEKGKTECK